MHERIIIEGILGHSFWRRSLLGRIGFRLGAFRRRLGLGRLWRFGAFLGSLLNQRFKLVFNAALFFERAGRGAPGRGWAL